MAKKNVKKATDALANAGLENELKQSDTDKQNVARAAQQLRLEIEAKDKCIESLRASCSNLSVDITAQQITINELKKELVEAKTSRATVSSAPSVVGRSELGGYAATIFAGILAAHDKPSIILTENTCLDAVKGARILATILDREFGNEENER